MIIVRYDYVIVFYNFIFMHSNLTYIVVVFKKGHSVIVFELYFFFFQLQVVDAKVIQLDYNNNRIFLSLKDVKVLGLIPFI